MWEFWAVIILSSMEIAAAAYLVIEFIKAHKERKEGLHDDTPED